MIKPAAHYQRLMAMYQAAPINDFFLPTLTLSEGEAEISIDLSEKLFHAAGAVHGSVYFKMLDDAAFFAASSLEFELFMLTTSFTTYLTRPVSSGTMRACGKVVNRNKSQFIVEAVVYDNAQRELGRGSGIFVRSKQRLANTPGYADTQT